MIPPPSRAGEAEPHLGLMFSRIRIRTDAAEDGDNATRFHDHIGGEVIALDIEAGATAFDGSQYSGPGERRRDVAQCEEARIDVEDGSDQHSRWLRRRCYDRRHILGREQTRCQDRGKRHI